MVAHRLALMALLGSLLIPAVAWADGEPFREHRMQEISPPSSHAQPGSAFARLDTNGDGRISTAEADTRPLPEPFWNLDRNQDGYLTLREYRQLSY